MTDWLSEQNVDAGHGLIGSRNSYHGRFLLVLKGTYAVYELDGTVVVQIEDN
ncbi:MAG TPA: hypothetical protein VMB66_17325 [Candidatus Acidoferrales bacterium]|nr:hypothetical protein [Candidatus Acidoferrales bacterium]